MAVFIAPYQGGSKVTSSPGKRKPSEINISQNGNNMHLQGTGSGSKIHVLMAYTDKTSVKWKNHFGMLIEQQGEWVLTWNKSTSKGKYLLIDQFDHLRYRIRITVHDSSWSAKNLVLGVLGDVKKNIKQFHVGNSSAACWRFLGDEVINHELGMTWGLVSRSTIPGGLFYEDKTNSFRLLASLYLHLMVPYHIAKRLTTEKNREYWQDQLKSSQELKECRRDVLSLYNVFWELSRDHMKMRRTVNRLVQQCSFTTRSKIQRVRILLSDL